MRMLNTPTLALALSCLAVITPRISAADCARAYWIPFDAELYTPENEASIEARAFEKRSISIAAAEALSPQRFPGTAGSAYQPGNTRALVRLADRQIYIDRDGWIRQGDTYGKAPVAEIEQRLSTPCTEP